MWNADHVGSNFCIDKSIVEIFPSCGNPVHKSGTCILALWIFFPHRLKVADKKRELGFAAAGFFGIVMYFMMENTALTMTYASNVGIIVACAPFLLRLWLEFSLKANDREETFYRICDRHNRNYSDQPERAEKPEFKSGR